MSSPAAPIHAISGSPASISPMTVSGVPVAMRSPDASAGAAAGSQVRRSS